MMSMRGLRQASDLASGNARSYAGVLPRILHNRALPWTLAAALATFAAASQFRSVPRRRVYELTLAGLRPGVSRLRDALRRFGPRWSHPSGNERDIYRWYDPRRRLLLAVEVNHRRVVRYVTVWRRRETLAPARLPAGMARTGHGLRLGNSLARALAIYGRPFFAGPSRLAGRPVEYLSFKFSWAGADKPQILECSFNPRRRLVKMTLSAEYY